MDQRKPWFGVIVVVSAAGALFLLLLLVIVALIWPESLRQAVHGFEWLSALLAIVDDLILRLLGLALLLVGATGFLWELCSGIRPNDSPCPRDDSYYWKRLIAYGAALGISGAALFGSYELDERDVELRKQLIDWEKRTEAGSPPVDVSAIRAWWVQVVPGNDQCELPLDFAGSNKPAVSSASGSKPAGPAERLCRADLSIRAIVNADSRCPAISTKDGGSLQMKERQKFARDGFKEIEVCELTASRENIERITGFAGIPAPIPTGALGASGPARIVAFGDTGCRLNEDRNCSQDWPFKEIVQQAAHHTSVNEKPLVVIHLGDYLYIKKTEDTWNTWENQFFKPAVPLLKAAPWIMVRGNHERCGKYGEGTNGYNLFFGHGPATSCAAEDELSKTYALDLTAKLRLIVADSSIAYATHDKKLPEYDCAMASAAEVRTCDSMKSTLRNVRRLSSDAGDRKVWLATHVPVFAVDSAASHSDDPEFIPGSTVMMFAAWRAEPIPKLSAILSGDRHLFQVVPVQDRNPLQLIVGTGGVDLDPLPFKEESSTSKEANFPVVKTRKLTFDSWAKGCSYRDHGFLIAEPLNTLRPFTFVPRGQTVSASASSAPKICEHVSY